MAEIYVEAKGRGRIKRPTAQEKKERKKMLLHAFWYSHGCPCEDEE